MSTPSILQQALARCIAERLTFAAFRVPGKPVQLWAQRSPELEAVEGPFLLGLNQVFLIAPFLLAPERIPFIRSDVELRFAEIDPDITRLGECQGAPSIPAAIRETDRQDFIQAVERAREACTQRQLDKVVLSRVKEVPLEMERLPELFSRAMTDNPAAFVVMACTPEHGLWMGASPERLVHEDQDHVRVDALAGTMAADAVPARISGWGDKELNEQELVMQHVHSVFAHMDLAGITVRGPEVMRAGPVAHLHTVLEADLAECLLGDLVLALHPTPAVCGTPREAARAFIGEQEKHGRSLYTGFWGPWNADGPTELFVNLRCMQVEESKAHLFVGAGITAASNAEQEWTETERKADTWLRLLAKAEAAG
jgi:isochorismate synthase